MSAFLLVVTLDGYAKRVPVDEIPKTRINRKSVKLSTAPGRRAGSRLAPVAGDEDRDDLVADVRRQPLPDAVKRNREIQPERDTALRERYEPALDAHIAAHAIALNFLDERAPVDRRQHRPRPDR